jgi:hypothetical protein
MEAKMEPSDFAALLTAIGGLGTAEPTQKRYKESI